MERALRGCSASAFCSAVTYLFNQRPPGAGRGYVFVVQLDAAVALVLIFILLLFKFIFCHLYSVFYDVGHSGKHSRVSFPSLETDKPDKSPGGLLTYF